MSVTTGVQTQSSMERDPIPSPEKVFLPEISTCTCTVHAVVSVYNCSISFNLKAYSMTILAPTQKHDPIQQHLYSRLKQIQHGMQAKDTEVAAKKYALSEAQNARDIARDRLSDVEKQTLEVQTNVGVLTKKVSDIQRQLKSKESDLKATQKLQETENEEFQVKLQQKLEDIQTELASERDKALSLQEQFQQGSKELADKSARVRSLEKAQQKVETQLDIERMRVDQLQKLAASASESQHNQEMEVQYEVYDSFCDS